MSPTSKHVSSVSILFTILSLAIHFMTTSGAVNNVFASVNSKDVELLNVTFIPAAAKKIVEHQNIMVTILIDGLDEELSRTDDKVFDPTMDINQRLSFMVEPVDGGVVSIRQITDFKRNVDTNGYTVELTLHALILGKTTIKWSVTDNYTGKEYTYGSYLVSVIRSPSNLNLVFTIFVLIIVTINNVNMGCLIDWKTIQGVLMKPIAPIIGFVSQFVIMPLGSYVIGYIFFPTEISWRLGLFTLGCCPGGTGSNFWTLMFDGDVDLSVTMTFISTIAAMGMMPLWMFTLGAQLLEQGNVKIPYVNLISSLISMTVPLLIGLAIQKYKPSWAAFLRSLLKPFTAFVIVVLVVGGTWISWYIFKLMTCTIVGAGLAVALSGYVCGAVLALVCGLRANQVVAVSIETALQNPGVAFVLLQLSMGQPESDLAAIPIVAQLLMTGIPLWTTYLVYILIKKFCCCGCDVNGSKKSSRTPSVTDVEMKSTIEPLNNSSS